MPHVVTTQGAQQGLTRCRRFLSAKTAEAPIRAAQAIARALLRLEAMPDIGRPQLNTPELRELPIAFGDSGYVALYRHESRDDTVYVLAFRHQKDAGY